MTIISKTAGSISIISALIDIHKTSKIYMQKERQNATANACISKSIGSQKTNRLSFKDTKRKNWLAQHDFLLPIKETLGSIKGYFKGVKEGIIRYFPKFILAALSIVPNKDHKLLSNISAVGLGILEIHDFLANGTNIKERTDYLE